MPEGVDWSTLAGKDGGALETPYRRVLKQLGKQHGLLRQVLRKAQNKIQDPAKRKRPISDLLDKEHLTTPSPDSKGEACKGLLERVAQDTKSGAADCVTTRLWIDATIECEAALDPRRGRTAQSVGWPSSRGQINPKGRDVQDPGASPRKVEGPLPGPHGSFG